MYRRPPARNLRAERWAREDEAPRLVEQYPQLAQLRFELSEHLRGHVVAGSRYTKHIIVARSAALFEIACAEPKCEEGGYDLTSLVLNALARQLPEFEGVCECNGYCGDIACGRELHLRGWATFTADSARRAAGR